MTASRATCDLLVDALQGFAFERVLEQNVFFLSAKLVFIEQNLLVSFAIFESRLQQNARQVSANARKVNSQRILVVEVRFAERFTIDNDHVEIFQVLDASIICVACCRERFKHDSFLFRQVSFQQIAQNLLLNVPVLLHVAHKVQLVDDKLAIVLLNVVVVAQDLCWDSDLQPNVGQAIVDKVTELGVDPRRANDCSAESVTQMIENHLDELVV